MKYATLILLALAALAFIAYYMGNPTAESITPPPAQTDISQQHENYTRCLEEVDFGSLYWQQEEAICKSLPGAEKFTGVR